MSTQDINTPLRTAEATDEKRPITHLLLIGVVSAVVVAALAILTLSDSSGSSAASGGGGMLLYAPAAFLAGIFSFLSPCTLPILPAYFAFTFQARRERVVLMTIAFFLGLATTMVTLGASATALSQLLFHNLRELQLIGGLLVIGFGAMSFFGKGFTGVQLLDRPAASVAGSYIYGATFALGWSACVGPIFGTLLSLLATQGLAVLQGAVLAFIYALGIGAPLIVVASFFSRLGTGSQFWKIMRGRSVSVNLGLTTLHLHTTSIISGALLIFMGVLLATDQLTRISAWSQQTPMAQWGFGLEQGIEHLFLGR